MDIRLLRALHSLLAGALGLAGGATVFTAMSDHQLVHFNLSTIVSFCVEGAILGGVPAVFAVQAIRRRRLWRPAADIVTGVLIAFASAALFLSAVTMSLDVYGYVAPDALPISAGGATAGLVYWLSAGLPRTAKRTPRLES